jgi:potassium-transporting ATPase KdpC subunit
MKQTLRPALVLFVVLSLVTGLLYPLLITAIGRAVFPQQASGSLIIRDGKLVGSELIGQSFSDPKYFWGRPSATAPVPYNGVASGGSNLAPTNPALVDAVKARVDAFKAAAPWNQAAIPIDLVTASASGLDPHISPAAAAYQVKRVAKARGVEVNRVAKLVEEHTEPRQWRVFGEPRVNVLELNLAVDRAQ